MGNQRARERYVEGDNFSMTGARRRKGEQSHSCFVSHDGPSSDVWAQSYRLLLSQENQNPHPQSDKHIDQCLWE